MGLRIGRGGHPHVEIGGNRVLADDRVAVICDEHGDGVAAGAFAEQETVLPLDGDLPGDVVDPELGEPLPNTTRGWAPLRLPELEHQE